MILLNMYEYIKHPIDTTTIRTSVRAPTVPRSPPIEHSATQMAELRHAAFAVVSQPSIRQYRHHVGALRVRIVRPRSGGLPRTQVTYRQGSAHACDP